MILLHRPSPNYSSRPAGTAVDLVVIHGTTGTSSAGDLSWMQSKRAGVSYHYLIGRTGSIYRLVDESRRAWHAGVSSWEGRADCNDYSVGVALSNKGPGEAYTDAQYAALAELVRDIMARRGIPLERVVGHVDVAVPKGRKTDPWAHFDWTRFRTDVLARPVRIPVPLPGTR